MRNHPPPWGHRARNWLERGIRELFEGFGLHRCMYLSNLSKWTFKIYAFHCILKVFPLQPTDWAAPRITLMVLESSLAKNQCHICQTMLTVLSKVIFPWCLMFFCFFLSLHGSLRAVMFRPVCSEWPVPLSSSDPSGPQLPCKGHHQPFFGERPREPILGARADVAPTFSWAHGFDLIGLNLGVMEEAAGVGRIQTPADKRWMHLGLLQARSPTASKS